MLEVNIVWFLLWISFDSSYWPKYTRAQRANISALLNVECFFSFSPQPTKQVLHTHPALQETQIQNGFEPNWWSFFWSARRSSQSRRKDTSEVQGFLSVSFICMLLNSNRKMKGKQTQGRGQIWTLPLQASNAVWTQTGLCWQIEFHFNITLVLKLNRI